MARCRYTFHPRVCGGKSALGAHRPGNEASFPAHAGETNALSRFIDCVTFHPRVRGGNGTSSAHAKHVPSIPAFAGEMPGVTCYHNTS